MKNIVVTMMVLCVGLAGLCPAGSDVMEKYRKQKKLKPADGKYPTVTELLDKYTQALDSTKSFIGNYELVGDHSSDSAQDKKAGTISYRGHVRHDNQRFYYQKYMWGCITSRFPDMPENTPNYNCSIINNRDKRAYWHSKSHGVPGTVSLQPYSEENVPIAWTPGISYLTGYIESEERLDSVLRKADRIIVSQTTEKVGDSDCFVIEADTKYGRYKLWLDPEHGYHPAKMRQRASGKEGNYYYERKMPERRTIKAYLDNVRFEKIDGIWVPVEADAGHDLRNQPPSSDFAFATFDYHYKRTDIILNPDHDKLGSFANPILEDPSNDSELMNGTIVRQHLSPNSRSKFTWQDGTLIDKDGKKVDMEKIPSKEKNAEK